MIKLGLLGWPVSHSLSPKLQNAALHERGLEGEYHLFPVDPAHPEGLSELINRVRNGELTGVNVTIPYKQAVIPLMDELTPSAQRIGAINAIYSRNGRLIGHNTDAPGFTKDLQKKAGGAVAPGGLGIVLGAGGSSRAVVSALVDLSMNVKLAARNLDQAKALASVFSGSELIIECLPLQADSLAGVKDEADLIINTTPVGMYPNVEYSPWPEGIGFPKSAFTYDLIYNPATTLFVQQAREHGLKAANGLGMLVEQAALGFEIWTGQTASVDAMYSAVANFL